MKVTLNEYEFLSQWRDSIRAEQFSRAALVAMFEYLGELEQDTGEEMELDIIALCCDWSEYDTAREAADEYCWTVPAQDEGETADDYATRVEGEALEWLQGESHAIDFEGGVLVLNF